MWKAIVKIVGTGTVTEPLDRSGLKAFDEAGENLRKTVRSLYGGRALHIRHVDAGSTNGEEYELTALGNAYYDIERFGLSFVASPRHADILTVSGPVTRNMEHALKTAYGMTPEPKIVVAIGDGAVTGGIWAGSYAVIGAVERVIPVDVKIPGDPPEPIDILRGLLGAIESAKK
jgi:Ni,Fe-hydrogenase III small subunit